MQEGKYDLFIFYRYIVPETILLSTSYPQKSSKNSQSTNYLLKKYL